MTNKTIKNKTCIAICAIENKKIVTERNYFASKIKTKNSSLKYDLCTMGSCGISDLIFESFDFHKILKSNSEIQRFKNTIEKVNPKVYEIFLICDRDENFSVENMRKIENEFKCVFSNFQHVTIELILYTKSGDKFENFLKMHNVSRTLYEGYTKEDINVYKKQCTMVKNAILNLCWKI